MARSHFSVIASELGDIVSQLGGKNTPGTGKMLLYRAVGLKESPLVSEN